MGESIRVFLLLQETVNNNIKDMVTLQNILLFDDFMPSLRITLSLKLKNHAMLDSVNLFPRSLIAR
jgi:hypothetical protein